ncbi:MAG: hypothetical protein G8345_08390 [Magnetococcales bacterium]|nr:hypothetical protein [Magnetococcales bacterium]
MNQLSLKSQINLLAIVLLMILLIVSTTGLFSINKIGNQLEEVAQQDIPLSTAIAEITSLQLEQGMNYEKAFRHGLGMRHNESDARAFSEARQEINKISKSVELELKKAEEIAKAMSNQGDESARMEGRKVVDHLTTIAREHTDFEKHLDEIFHFLQENKVAEAEKLSEKTDKEMADLDHQLQNLQKEVSKFTNEAAHEAERTEHRAIWLVFILVGIGFVVGIGTLWVIRRSVTQRVEEISGMVEAVAAGSSQLSSTSQVLADGASEQAASVEESSASVEELSANIQSNAENAHQTQLIAEKAAQNAIKSADAVRQTVEAMKEIAGKIGIIEEIARQTDLLALNAAIEAARAGDQGRGFAVVAAEVRKLAERSQGAAAEINKVSASSVHIAEQAGNMIQEMIPAIQKTTDLVQEISSASQEQNSGVEQINTAMQQLSNVIQQNAGASEESSSMAEELSAQCDMMREAMGYFHGGATTVHPMSLHAHDKPAAKLMSAPLTIGKQTKKSGGASPKYAALEHKKGATLNMKREDNLPEFEPY